MKILEDKVYPATLRDARDQILATGEVRLYASEPRGVFWPHTEVTEDLILKNATSVLTSDGHMIEVRNIQTCSSPPHPHFDFEWRPPAAFS